ncbi:MAG: hypothetical protein QOH92_189 [Chloroflexota bacterium]|jgi:hypothetical protein|nr:hypothetical protein [Chloroflexota bacterium]
MDKQVAWPSAAVAIALLVVIGAVTVAAITKYPVDDALKVWTALTAIVGVITGAFVSYFFTRGTVQQALEQTQKAHAQANSIRQAASLNETALRRIPGHLEPKQWQDLLLHDNLVRAAYESPVCNRSLAAEVVS